jgi:hypothetical protein
MVDMNNFSSNIFLFEEMGADDVVCSDDVVAFGVKG